jgi:hypothetical protein
MSTLLLALREVLSETMLYCGASNKIAQQKAISKTVGIETKLAQSSWARQRRARAF